MGNYQDTATGVTPWVIKFLVFAVLAVLLAITAFTITSNLKRQSLQAADHAISSSLGIDSDVGGVGGDYQIDSNTMNNNWEKIEGQQDGISGGVKDIFSWD